MTALAVAGTAVNVPPSPSTEELRVTAVRATLTAVAVAARRHDHVAIQSLSAALSALKESA